MNNGINYPKTQISFSATICNGAFLDFEIFFFLLWIINQEKYNIFLAINPFCLEKIINRKITLQNFYFPHLYI